MGRFSAKTAVITGSGRRQGLGQAIAKRLAEEGAAIVISDIGQAADPATPSQHIGATEEMEAIAQELDLMIGGPESMPTGADRARIGRGSGARHPTPER